MSRVIAGSLSADSSLLGAAQPPRAAPSGQELPLSGVGQGLQGCEGNSWFNNTLISEVKDPVTPS